MFFQRTRAIYCVVLVGLFIVIGAVMQNDFAYGQAVSIDTFQSMLLRYQTSLARGDRRNVLIRLVEPLQPGDDVSIFVPDRTDIDDGVSHRIYSVGIDHICFEVTRGVTASMSCVPFTNIATVRELY